MDERDRLALRLARQWNAEGLLPDAGLRAIERRHGATDSGSTDGRESFGSSVLYGLGGVLVGAAAFAFLVLLQDNGFIRDMEDVAPWLLFGWGIACLAGALSIDLVARRPALGDAFHVAALVAVTASGFPHADDLPFGWLAMLFAAGVVAYRRNRFMVPFLGIVAFNVAWTSVLFLNVARHASEDLAITMLFAYALVQVAALALAGRVASWPWPSFALSAATLLVAGSFLGYFFDVLEEAIAPFDGDVEVYLALLMGTALAAGLWLREKGMVLASALVIAIDAIVFAFDVGEIVGGLIAILAVAGLLIWQAGALRRYLRE